MMLSGLKKARRPDNPFFPLPASFDLTLDTYSERLREYWSLDTAFAASQARMAGECG
jgi:hypothetical protein